MELSAQFSVATPTVVEDVVIYGGWILTSPSTRFVPAPA